MRSNGKYLMAILVSAAAFTTGSGQTSKPKVKVYHVIITPVYQAPAIKGVALAITDSTITVLSKDGEIRLPPSSIRRIKFRRKASVGRGAMIGGVTGLALGAIVGFADGDDECPPGSLCIFAATAEEKALAGGLVLCATGSIVGAIIGATSGRKFRINGNQDTFISRRDEMKAYLQTLP